MGTIILKVIAYICLIPIFLAVFVMPPAVGWAIWKDKKKKK